MSWTTAHFGIECCRETIRQTLKQLGLSWKKARKLLNKADTDKRAEFLETLKGLLGKALQQGHLLIYIDEAHIHLDTDEGYGWSVKGERFWSEFQFTRTQIGVPEFWHYNGNKLQVFVLQKSTGEYQSVSQSPTFPWKPLDLIPRFIRQSLSENDYPVLNTRLFVKCWLSYAMDKSLTSMRDLFKRLNNTGFPVDISSFSKANIHRSQEPFIQIYQKLYELVNKKGVSKQRTNYLICPIDSTTITLTSKLVWVQGYHQVKLFSSLNLSKGLPEESLINFGYDPDYNYGKEMIDALPEKGLGVIDRGFAGLDCIKQVSECQKYFVRRISNSWKLEFDDDTGLTRVESGKKAGVYRVINFCGLETKTESRLVTNLLQEGEMAVTDEEVMEIYRRR